MTLPVIQLLQAKNNDILDGVELIQVLKNLAMTARNQIDYYYDQWYNQAVSVAAKVDIGNRHLRTFQIFMKMIFLTFLFKFHGDKLFLYLKIFICCLFCIRESPSMTL